MHRAYIGLGSNIEPERNIPAAVAALARLGTVAAVSSVYESPAAGDAAQPAYLNAAVLLCTGLSADELCCTYLPEIEARLGRVRDPLNKCAARTIDLDLVLFDREITTAGRRRIPDPDILERSFLAVPLAEVDGEYRHPETGERLSAIARRVQAHGPELTPRPDVILSSA